MKKAPVLITFGVIALALAIIFLSQKRGKEEIDYWQLVPASAIGVMETHKPAAFQKLGVDSIGLVKIIVGIGGRRGFTEPHLFCFQSTGKQIEWAVLLPRGFPSPLDTLSSLKKSLTKRNYEGNVLYDFRNGSAAWATLVNVDGIWAISPSSLLVEEIVRQSIREEGSFRNTNKQLFTLATVKQDDGNLYLNLSKTSAANGRRTPGNEHMQRFSHSMVLDLKWNDRNLQGNGFAADTAAFSTVLSAFTDQKPVPFELRKRIPEQFSSAIHFGFSDPELWFVNRDKVYASGGSETLSAPLDTLFGFSTSEFAKAVDNEVMYCKFAEGGEVIIFELKEITRAQTQMDKIRRAVSTEKENYADRTIYRLQVENSLASLVWPLAIKSHETFYTFDGNLMLVSGEKESIKQFIDFTERDQILGKSIVWSKFLETTLGESNVDFIFNSSVDPQFANSLGLPLVAPIDKASLQFYALKGNYYSSASIQFAGGSPVIAKAARPDMLTVKFANRVLHSPWLVRNHQERQNEVMVQDEAFNLRFMDGDGRVRWTTDIKSAITTSIEEMDYLKNGKIQYLFCTTGELHLVDRLGNYVKGFPRKLDVKAPQWLSVVDYDKSRNYRIVVADNDGRILVMDKNGKALEGWNPKSLGQAFADAPTHYRIGGRDYYVALTVRGDLHLFARNGAPISQFPVSIGAIPSGNVFCDGELISIVSESGMLTKIGAGGKKELEEPILKNITGARFCLVVSSDRKDFIVTRIERGNLAVFDSSGRQKFEIVNPLSDNVEVQYHKLPGRPQVVIVRDKEQGLLYVLNGTGKLLTEQPVPASHSPAVDLTEEGEAKLFICSDDNLNVLKLRLR